MIRPYLPLNALRAFEAAARHRSFKKAAIELCVTPAALSHQVKALEERLGTLLFRRLPRGLRSWHHHPQGQSGTDRRPRSPYPAARRPGSAHACHAGRRHQ